MQNTLFSSIKKQWLHSKLQQSPLAFVLYVSITSFIVYASMFGFRKPFTAATFSNYQFMGISYKVCLVIAQVVGYMLSKFYGIKFIGTMKPENRAKNIFILIGLAWLSLLLFAIVPRPYNIICLFLNGLPLGLIWGLVFGYLEGRRVTELLGAILATSFIFGSGFAKFIGKWLLNSLAVSEFWMPFVAGFFFVIPLVICVWLLNLSPHPSPEDVAQRSIRKPMSDAERKAFLKKFALALTPIIMAYVMLTILRDFCEDFANELWIETGYQNNAKLFAQNSTITSVIVLAVIGGFYLLKNNYKAFQLNHSIILFGFLLAAGATYLFHLQLISPIYWMLLATSGLYLGYVPYNCFYFERLLAAYKVQGNVGFVMYIADAFGYLGTVTVLLIKEFITFKYSWVSFFSFLFYTAAIFGVLLIFVGSKMFANIYKRQIKVV